MPKSIPARTFVTLIVLSGLLVLVDAVLNTQSISIARFVLYLAAASLAARMRIKLPGITGTMSVNLPFILVAAAEMNATEAFCVAFISTFFQCLPRNKREFNVVQTAFNCNTITLATVVTRFIYASTLVSVVVSSPALRLLLAAAGYFLANTIIVAVVLHLMEHANFLRTWAEMFLLAFPYMVAGASVAGLILTISRGTGWQATVITLPVMFGVFLSYRRFFAAMNQKVSAADASAVHV